MELGQAISITESERRLDALKDALSVSRHCHAGVARGIHAICRELSTHHSLTSRRYSVWALLRKHLDIPFGRFVQSLKSPIAETFFGENPPSKALSSVKRQVDEAPFRHAERAVNHWELKLRNFLRKFNESVHGNSLTPKEERRCYGTISSVRELFITLRGLSATRASVSNATGPLYCELCWRPTMLWQSEHYNLPSSLWPVAFQSSQKPSKRFCHIHVPGVPGSKYRSDLRYRDAFRRELHAQILKGRGSAYILHLRPPPSADESEMRKLAYDQVHSGIGKKRGYRGSHGTREVAAVLFANGTSVAKIAEKMGISRQAVYKALKSLREALDAHETSKYVNPNKELGLELHGIGVPMP